VEEEEEEELPAAEEEEAEEEDAAGCAGEEGSTANCSSNTEASLTSRVISKASASKGSWAVVNIVVLTRHMQSDVYAPVLIHIHILILINTPAHSHARTHLLRL
jgi:hypothetical protein